uniref:SET domain-containing protein n=1 Tax=Meloidogyne incognita TaxID=6306 RepID=A0A914KLV4_MELIC
MNDFIKWLESDGNILFSNVDICLIDKSVGYGLFTKENVRLNEVLIKIPEKYIITADFVSNIKEYADILNRFVFDSSELLALFFAFERVYFDYFCKQLGSLNDGTAYFVQWTLEMPNGFKHFLNCRKELMNEKRNESDFWWKSYIGILPRNFSTPLFIYYLKENGNAKIKEIASQLPIETKEKLLGQLDELIIFEEKFLKLLLNSFEGDTFQIAKTLSQDSIVFWREVCCWAWHIVNTRSIFTENLSLHSVDKQKSCDKNQKICSKKKNKTDEENFGGSLALVPLVDMLNHSPDASVYFQLIRVCGYNLRTLLLEYHPVSLVHCLLFRFDI